MDLGQAVPFRYRFVIASVVAIAIVAFMAYRLMERRVALTTRPLRLAVLPFENLTGNQDQRFFADGLHEEMIFRLGRIQPSALTVIARTSVIRYQDAPKAIAAI